MRHKKQKFTLNNRFSSWRKATLKSLVRNLLIQQSIHTTITRAKSAKPLAEEMISLGKANTLAAKRRAFETLGDHGLVSKLFSDIAPRFKDRAGGYTRMIRLGKRRGDNAEMAIFELTEIKKIEHKKRKEKKAHVHEDNQEAGLKEQSSDEQKPKTESPVREERAPINKKPDKKFLGGIKNIFKKERDSL